MKRPVAIIVALVVIAGVGVAAYVGFGDRDPATETAAVPATAVPVEATTPPAETAATPPPAAPTPPATENSSAANADVPAAATTDSGAPATAAGSGTSAAPQTAGNDTAAPATAPPPPVITAEDHSLGNPEAPVTIVEYASMTCPHCAAFSKDTMPKLKSEFIDKGQVRYVFRPFPLDRLALRASLMAACVPGDGYFVLLERLFATQQDWTQAANPLDALRALGKEAGLEDSKIDSCMTDEKAIDRIAVAYKEAVDVYGVSATPSFLINGKKFSGALPFDDLTSSGTTVNGLNTIIRELLPK
ncbi:MAG: DsbA family protein [Dongiaceae bacterium]